MSVPTSLRYN